MHIIIKVLLTAAVIMALIWIYGWYKGKTAPSTAEVQTEQDSNYKTAYVAGGCFWCTENDYQKIDGIIEATSGYMGGEVENPSYNDVTKGTTGHREMVKLTYDPTKISYKRIALELLRETDPTDEGGSFADRGYQYTSAIYYQTTEQKRIAEEVIQTVEELNVFDKPIATKVEKANTFWRAEAYHQDFAKNNAVRYGYYRKASGRDAFIEKYWGTGEYNYLFENEQVNNHMWKNFEKPSSEELKETLTPLQYKITQKEGTERPFDNEYWENHEEGIYVDIVSGEPLFSSKDKFDSGTGWPSFLKPIDSEFIVEKKDYKLIIPRIEVRSTYADSHLGHILLDGPASNDKVRYCINSAALRFIPKDNLEQEGLASYTELFEDKN